MPENTNLSELLHYLVSHDYISLSNALEAEKIAKEKNISLLFYLGLKKYIPYRELACAVANYFNLPFIELNHYDLKGLPQNILSLELIQKYSVLPINKKEDQL